MLHAARSASPTPRIDDRENVGVACQPVRVVTVERYARLVEPAGCRYELCAGEVVVSPWPSPDHQLARGELCAQLMTSTPPGLVAIAGIGVDLGLGAMGTVRRPDIVVVTYAAYRWAEDEWTFLRADEAALVVEIVSADSAHIDRVVKRAEYAAAGVGHYWIVDLDAPISLLSMRLVDDLGYAEDGEVTGVCSVDGPFLASLRLDELAR